LKLIIIVIAKPAGVAIVQDAIAPILWIETTRSTSCVPKLLEQERQRRGWSWSSGIRARIEVLDEADGVAEVITIAAVAELLYIDTITKLANDPS